MRAAQQAFELGLGKLVGYWSGRNLEVEGHIDNRREIMRYPPGDVH